MIHLTVIQSDDDNQVKEFACPMKDKVRWGKDYSYFEVIRLPYWDHNSYLTYQGDHDEP